MEMSDDIEKTTSLQGLIKRRHKRDVTTMSFLQRCLAFPSQLNGNFRIDSETASYQKFTLFQNYFTANGVFTVNELV